MANKAALSGGEQSTKRRLPFLLTIPVVVGALTLVGAGLAAETFQNKSVFDWPAQSTVQSYALIEGAEIPTSPVINYYQNGSDLSLEVLKSGDRYRLICTREEGDHSLIYRDWVIYLDRRQYEESKPLIESKFPLDSWFSSAGEIWRRYVESKVANVHYYLRAELEPLGTDTVNGDLCEKFQTKSAVSGIRSWDEIFSGTEYKWKDSGAAEGPTLVWVSRRTQEIVEIEVDVRGVTFGMKVVSLGPPDSAMFRVPAGFRKVDK
jgi:hypothetical protein